MMTFLEFVERHVGAGLPGAVRMLGLAGVSLGTPSDEDIERLVDRAKKWTVLVPVNPPVRRNSLRS